VGSEPGRRLLLSHSQKRLRPLNTAPRRRAPAQDQSSELRNSRTTPARPASPQRLGSLRGCRKVGTAVSAPERSKVDLAGHPYTIFKRALERGNLMGAEATAKELPRLGLADALELTLLMA
jgi:hypothetical protein